jgi:large repetitive protein
VPAAITSFTPTNSAPGTTVTITGSNFTDASAVTFNGAPAMAFTVTNNTTIGAIVPFGVSTGPIGVTTPAGTATSAGLFYAPPVITGFTPTHGLPGNVVTILGTNFLGTTAVRFAGLNAANFTATNNGSIQATVPNGAQTGPITVVAPAGSATSAASFVLDYTSDVNVTLTAAPDPVWVGSNLVYTIVVANAGPFAAPNVRLTNTLPASVILKGATTTAGTLDTNSNPVLGAISSLGVGVSATITLTVGTQLAGTITNTVRVASDYADPVSTNNLRAVSTTVLPLPVLSIRRVPPNQVRISLPVMLTNYVLQARSTLPPAGTWTNITAAPVISGNERVITETNSSAARFYRLRQ